MLQAFVLSGEFKDFLPVLVYGAKFELVAVRFHSFVMQETFMKRKIQLIVLLLLQPASRNSNQDQGLFLNDTAVMVCTHVDENQ